MSSVLALGSNLGDRMAYLRQGVAALEPTAVSSVYETEPWGGVEQGEFLNLVVLCPWDAAEAWRRAVQAEAQALRTRDVPWGPRTLDVDVITATGSAAGLELPHPRAHDRAFVLIPWLEVEPLAELEGVPVVELVAGLDPSTVRRIGPLQ